MTEPRFIGCCIQGLPHRQTQRFTVTQILRGDDMHAKLLVTLVKQCIDDGYDHYAIATEVAEKQREIDADFVESAGYPELAEQLRDL